MRSFRRSVPAVLTLLAVLLIAALVLSVSFELLPAPPHAATPTWPLGIDLPDKLPRPAS